MIVLNTITVSKSNFNRLYIDVRNIFTEKPINVTKIEVGLLQDKKKVYFLSIFDGEIIEIVKKKKPQDRMIHSIDQLRKFSTDNIITCYYLNENRSKVYFDIHFKNNYFHLKYHNGINKKLSEIELYDETISTKILYHKLYKLATPISL